MLSEKDSLDVWQYRIFRWVLFILFLFGVLKLVDDQLHIRQFLRRLFG